MNWSNVNIRQGKEIESLESDPFYKDNDIEKFVQQICIVMDKDEEWADSLPLNETSKLNKELEFLSQAPTGNFKREITIDGIDYHWVDLNSSSFSLGEFADLDSSCKDVMENLHKICAILYRPKGEKYNIQSMKERAEIFLEKMSYEDAFGASLFFCLLELDSMKHTGDSSILQVMMKKWMKDRDQLKEQLVEAGLQQKKIVETDSNGCI